jgi:hypothetical protein
MQQRDPVMTASEGEFLMRVAPGLVQRSDRFFIAVGTNTFSYPLSAQAQFAAIEESSFWFRYRNEVIGTLVRRFPPCGPILDIGGGNGYVSRGLTHLGFSTIVLEPGVEGAETAHGRGFTVIQAGFTSETFAAQSLPAIGLISGAIRAPH